MASLLRWVGGPALAAALLGPVAGAAGAQAPPGVTVGVALSGGNAKGLAHIGVLRVLERAGVPVHVVAGTSIGALVGGLYAIGFTPSTLEATVTALDWESLFREESAHRLLGVEARIADSRTIFTLPIKGLSVGLPTGAVSGDRIAQLLTRLTWTALARRNLRQLHRPFLAVATDLERGTVVVLDSGALGDAMRASMAMPSVFAPVRLHGSLLVDGYVLRNLPTDDARALGADVVICSDVTDPLYPASELHSMFAVMNQTLTIEGAQAHAAQARRCDILIRPDLKGLAAFDFGSSRTWIARGEAAALDQWPALRALAARAAPAPSIPAIGPTTAAAPIRLSAVRVPDVPPEVERFVRRQLHLAAGHAIGPDSLGEALRRVQASGFFTSVTSDLVPDTTGGATLIVRAVPDPNQLLGIGFRYDNHQNATLLFSGAFRHWLGYGSTARVDVRLGEQFVVNTQVIRHSTLGTMLTYGGSVRYVQTPFDLYGDARRTGQAISRVTSGRAVVGARMPFGIGVAAEVRAERSAGRAAIPLADSASARTYGALGAMLAWDTFSRRDFPTSGTYVDATAVLARGGAAFSYGLLNAARVVALAREWSAGARVVVGQAAGGAQVPLQYRFWVGGANPVGPYAESQLPFPGLAPQEFVGLAVQQAMATLQWSPRDRTYFTLRTAVGGTADRLAWNPGAATTGVGVSAGMLFPFGPIELTVSSRARRRSPRVDVRLGYTF